MDKAQGYFSLRSLIASVLAAGSFIAGSVFGALEPGTALYWSFAMTGLMIFLAGSLYPRLSTALLFCTILPVASLIILTVLGAALQPDIIKNIKNDNGGAINAVMGMSVMICLFFAGASFMLGLTGYMFGALVRSAFSWKKKV